MTSKDRSIDDYKYEILFNLLIILGQQLNC